MDSFGRYFLILHLTRLMWVILNSIIYAIEWKLMRDTKNSKLFSRHRMQRSSRKQLFEIDLSRRINSTTLSDISIGQFLFWSCQPLSLLNSTLNDMSMLNLWSIRALMNLCPNVLILSSILIHNERWSIQRFLEITKREVSNSIIYHSIRWLKWNNKNVKSHIYNSKLALK